ncbi:MAG: putative cell division protein [Acidimicrobiaceae bacterium]|nr:MAG: putative cell division protein [Acidimicrobiaceae bacterium]
MSIWKRAMDYLGLGPDDAYDDYDLPPEPEPRPVRSRQPRSDESAVRGQRAAPDYDDVSVRTVPARPSFPSRDADPVGRRPMPAADDSSVHPRPINPARAAGAPRGGSSMSSDPHTVRPRRFDSAQEIADKFKDGQPVIMNLEATDREVSRRLIDFPSGLCYGLDGTMEKVASGRRGCTRSSGLT